jgi:ribokinase
MAGRVFVFGSINTDLVVYVKRLPQPGETVSGGAFASFPGGKGANQAVAAARAGAAVEMYGCLGDDAFGRERIGSLEAAGVSTSRVRSIAGAASGIAQITVDAEGENTIAVAPGANALFVGEGIMLDRPPRGETWVSLFQNEVPQDATERLIARAHDAGHAVFWNLAPTLSRRPSDAALRAVDLLICNRNELDALTGGGAARPGEDIERQARVPLEWGVRSLVVTLGRAGSLWVSPSGVLRVDAFPVEAVDTVGAGDCFCGVLAAGAADGMDMPRALRRASAAAAISATRRGAQTSMPLRAEVDAFLTGRGG